MTRRLLRPALLLAVLLGGCAYGPVYWTQYDATPEHFLADHRQCFAVASIAAGLGSTAAYQSCMGQRGWILVQARGSQPVPEPHFRGPERDDDFTVASVPTPAELDEQCRRWRQGLDRAPSLPSPECR